MQRSRFVANTCLQPDEAFLRGAEFTGQILSSFNGATTTTLGDVTLPVRVGLVTQQVMFTVVGDLGPNNAIMGAGLAALDESCSFDLPQMVSYLTNDGQVDLLGSKLASKAVLSIIYAGT